MLDKIEKMCDPDGEEGIWLSQIDLVEEGDKLVRWRSPISWQMHTCLAARRPSKPPTVVVALDVLKRIGWRVISVTAIDRS